MNIANRIIKIDREVILLREELNKMKKFHLAGELSAISIILKELERYIFEEGLNE